MSAVPGTFEGVPGPAGGPGEAGPCALPPRERPLQPDQHVRAGVFSQHPEEAEALLEAVACREGDSFNTQCLKLV